MKERMVMRAQDLRLDELVSFSDGLVSLQGRRLILHDMHAMAQLRKDLITTVGADQSRRIFSRFGYYWGEADAAALKRVVSWDSFDEWLIAGPRVHMLQGVARIDVKSYKIGPSGTFHMEVVWRDSVEAEEHLLEFGPEKDASCWIMLGYASGYATFCMGRPVYFTERSCRARGDPLCEVIGKDRDTWGEGATQLEEYFQVEGIQGKIEELTSALRKKTRDLARQRKRLRQAESYNLLGGLELPSKSYRQVLDISRRVAPFASSVLITGESGAGKEVVAHFIHEHSPRRRRPFVAVNCGSLPETLLESELFGHKAGSFTGATHDRAGLFEQAQGGTILLDEIGDISQTLQVKLLRVLQDKHIRRVGENRLRKIDVRVIAATHRKLEKEVSEGRFREDLLYRLRVVEIHIPPLRDRREDILSLARYFSEHLARRMNLRALKLHPSTSELLERYSWPGNVRELENALERAAIMSEDGWIRPEHLPSSILHPQDALVSFHAQEPRTLAAMEREYTLAVLDSLDGNRTRTAQILGISTTTLWRKLKEWGHAG
jgi:two-component system response regulator HydG